MGKNLLNTLHTIERIATDNERYSYKGTLITSPCKGGRQTLYYYLQQKISEPDTHKTTLSKREQRQRTVGLWVSRKV